MISIGNISAGGTGKTPFAIFLAGELGQRVPKEKIAIALRGYGGKLAGRGGRILPGGGGDADPALFGDEAVLLSEKTGCPVFVGKDRATMIERYGQDVDVVLLDDAFQNPSVFRNADIVLIDTTIPISALRLFPFGRFREPLHNALRADCIVLTRTNLAVAENTLAYRAFFAGRENVFTSEQRPKQTQPHLEPGTRLGIFSGIGNPQAFRKTVSEQGYTIEEEHVFPDHHAYTVSDLQHLLGISNKKDMHWITTEKDMVRLRARCRSDARLSEWLSLWVHVVVLELRIVEADGFKSFLDGIMSTPLHGRPR